MGLLLFSSCSNFFNEEPVNSISSDEYFNSESALKIYATGLLDDYAPSAATLTRGDQYSDICVVNQTTGYLKEGYTAKDGGGWSWGELYDVNFFLKHIPDATGKVDDAVLKHYEGVGRFWRAWFYFDKVKYFGDVPWYSEPIDAKDDAMLYKKRDPRDTVMTKVLEDINFAVNNCSSAEAYVNKNVINKYVALALKSRICLYEGTYRKYHGLQDSEKWLRECVSASEEMMTNSPYSLLDKGDVTTNYSKVFKSDLPQYTEVILADEMSSTLGIYHDASWYYATSTGLRNSGAKAFINMYLNLDGSRFTDGANYKKVEFKDEFDNRDYRLRETFISPYYKKKISGIESSDFSKVFPGMSAQLTYYRIMKWNTDNDAQEGTTSSTNSLSIFRYGEILLNYAEAKAELGEMGTAEWNKSIRLLRERSGVNGKAPDTADPYLENYYDGLSDKWILEVRRERAIELYMENLRWDDLMRWKMGHKLTVEFAGLYVPEVGKAIDLNGDGTNDVCFYSKTHAKPSKTESSVTYVQITENGDAVTNFGLNADNCLVYKLDRVWSDYKYLHPIPQSALNINPDLGQNPGWELDTDN